MTTKTFSHALGEIGDKYVSEAISYTSSKKKNSWLKWGSMVACLCLVVGICILAIPSIHDPVQNNGNFIEGGDGIIPNDPVEGGDGIIPNDPVEGGGGTISTNPVDDAEVTFSVFAQEDIITEIRKDITDQKTYGWTNAENLVINYEHIVPIYTPYQLSKNDKTFSDTLAFFNQYIAPAISDGKCIGAFTITKYNGEWVIDSYIDGLDIETAIQQHESNALCFVCIPQFGFEYGFLTISNTGEIYTSLTDTFDKNSSGEELLKRLMGQNKTSGENAEG